MEIRAATPADLDPVFDLLTVRSRAAFGVSEVDRGELAEAWRVEGSNRLVADDGEIVGYAVLGSDGDTGFAGHDGVVLDALLERIERLARVRGLSQLSAIASSADETFDALVRRSGFAPRGEVLRMWRSLDDLPSAPSWPDGTRVRTYEDRDARAVQALLDGAYAAWDDTYVPRSHDDWLQWMTDQDAFDPELWFLVERGSELVACALHWKEHQRRGWVKDLVVRSDRRMAGLGRALVEHGLRTYAKRDVDRVGLKVDSTNPTGALRLYERTGFEVDRRYGIWLKPL